jgi:hypothetical protein
MFSMNTNYSSSASEGLQRLDLRNDWVGKKFIFEFCRSHGGINVNGEAVRETRTFHRAQCAHYTSVRDEIFVFNQTWDVIQKYLPSRTDL